MSTAFLLRSRCHLVYPSGVRCIATCSNHFGRATKNLIHSTSRPMIQFQSNSTQEIYDPMKLTTHSFSSNAAITSIDSSYSVEIVDDGSAVYVDFPDDFQGDKMTSKFHAAWLWSNCPSSVHPTSGQRQRTPGDYHGEFIVDATIIPAHEVKSEESVVVPVPSPPNDSCHPIGTLYSSATSELNDQLLLRVSWNNNSPSTSYFDLEWLRRWRYDEAALQERRARTEVQADHALCAKSKKDELANVDFHRFVGTKNNEAIFECLHAVFKDGATIVSNTPPNHDSVAVIAKALSGYLSHTSLYGDTFHVKSVTSAHNVAYTSFPLPPHQDLAYYESIPGLQLLHCVEFSRDVLGGESTLIDAMAAANELRRIAPHHFRTLVTCPATFVKQREGVCMTYQRPHIVLKEGDDMNDMNREIVAVNWSPPFEGPLCIPPDQVGSYYAAYASFQRMLDIDMPMPNDQTANGCEDQESHHAFAEFAKEHTWERRLEPGEILVFNNRRMLHGRKGFHSNDAGTEVNLDRHFIGAYTNIDDTLNRYRVLLRERQELSEYPSLLNAGNGTSSIP